MRGRAGQRNSFKQAVGACAWQTLVPYNHERRPVADRQGRLRKGRPGAMFQARAAGRAGHTRTAVSACRAWLVLRFLPRSEEHTSELQSLMRISYAVFCLKKKTYTKRTLTRKL